VLMSAIALRKWCICGVVPLRVAPMPTLVRVCGVCSVPVPCPVGVWKRRRVRRAARQLRTWPMRRCHRDALACTLGTAKAYVARCIHSYAHTHAQPQACTHTHFLLRSVDRRVTVMCVGGRTAPSLLCSRGRPVHRCSGRRRRGRCRRRSGRRGGCCAASPLFAPRPRHRQHDEDPREPRGHGRCRRRCRSAANEQLRSQSWTRGGVTSSATTGRCYDGRTPACTAVSRGRPRRAADRPADDTAAVVTTDGSW
jgi:hypothetical protein